MIKTDIASFVRTSLIIAAALGSAACAPEPVPVEVSPSPPKPEPIMDALFMTKVSDLVEGCTYSTGDVTATSNPDAFVSSDLLMHPYDGLFDLRVGGVATFYNLEIEPDGGVYYVFEDEISVITVSGSIDATRFDLQFDEHIDGQNTGPVSCYSTAKLDGYRRPIEDPSSPDGIYDAFAEIGPRNSCPVSNAVDSTDTVTMSIMQVSFSQYQFDGPGFDFTAGIAADGAVASTLSITDEVSHGTVATFTQQAAGSISAPDGQLTVELFMPNRDGVNCGQRSTLFLDKRIPDQTRPQNDYRVESVFTASEGCADESTTRSHMNTRIVTDDFGLLTLRDAYMRATTIALGENGYFKTVIKTLAADGRDLWVEGTVLDGHLDYEYVSIGPGIETTPACEMRVKSSGLLRYVPLAK